MCVYTLYQMHYMPPYGILYVYVYKIYIYYNIYYSVFIEVFSCCVRNPASSNTTYLDVKFRSIHRSLLLLVRCLLGPG